MSLTAHSSVLQAPQATPAPPTSRLTPVSDTQYHDGLTYLDISNSIPERKSPLHMNVTQALQSATLDISRRENGEILPLNPVALEQPLRTSTPEIVYKKTNPLDVANLTSQGPSKPKHIPDSKFNNSTQQSSPAPKLWSPVECVEKEEKKRMQFPPGEIDYSLPITTTYLKYMRSLGCTDEDALKFESRNVSRLIELFLHEAISHYYY